MGLDQAQGASPMFVETAKKNLDAKKKSGKSSTEANGKTSGKNAKDSADESKEDYIHVRARRGQATNSHSLAERVRFSQSKIWLQACCCFFQRKRFMGFI